MSVVASIQPRLTFYGERKSRPHLYQKFLSHTSSNSSTKRTLLKFCSSGGSNAPTGAPLFQGGREEGADYSRETLSRVK